jgi:hypothetical protein
LSSSTISRSHDADALPLRSGGRSRRARRALLVTRAAALLGAAAVTALLGGLLVSRNSLAAWTPGSVAELGAALLWMALLSNGLLVLELTLLYALLRVLLPRRVAGDRFLFLLLGLFAFHVTWILLNRISMTHQWVLPPRFITPVGIAESMALAVLAILIVVAGMAARHRRGRAALVTGGLAVLIAALCLFWNAREEVVFRSYPIEEVQRAAGAGPEPAGLPGRGEGPLIAVGIDGLSWNVMVPLLRAGALPHMASLIRQGSAGYLDNGDDSFSPRIWNEIWSGRPPSEHGIYGFMKLVLPRSGVSVPNLVSQYPAVDTFYGLEHLLKNSPDPGLWILSETDSRDVRVKRLWEIASDYGRRVVVANPLQLAPVTPIHGSAIAFHVRPGLPTAYPPSVGERWHPSLPDKPMKRSLEEWRQVIEEETSFLIELMRDERADLGVYYTQVVDILNHLHWRFFGPETFLMTDQPEALSDEQWEELVRERTGEPAIASYQVMDRAVGRLMRAFPGATFLICSDHGWSYSGYTHHGSPPGVLILSGSAVRKGVVRGAHIRDVTPTALTLLGVPLSRELHGEPLREALIDAPEVPLVASYGDPPRGGPAESEPVGEDTLELLKGMGYIR